jgi:lipoyl-dependent peroxiredoxin subunit D
MTSFRRLSKKPASTNKEFIMNFEDLKSRIPDYAKDIRLNLGSLATEASLTPAQRAGAFLASAYASGQPSLIAALEHEFAPRLSVSEQQAARSAAAVMAMNNVYYRFTHLVRNAEYGKLPAKLRMNVLANPGAAKADFELWSLAVSAINGCAMCMDAHEAVVRQHGLSAEAVQAAVRIAAVVNAAACVLCIESDTRESVSEPQRLAA